MTSKTVVDAVYLILKRRLLEHGTDIDIDRTTYQRIYYDNPIYSKYAGTSSSYTITKVAKQFALIKPDMRPCTHVFIIISGLPYKYFLY